MKSSIRVATVLAITDFIKTGHNPSETVQWTSSVKVEPRFPKTNSRYSEFRLLSEIWRLYRKGVLCQKTTAMARARLQLPQGRLYLQSSYIVHISHKLVWYKNPFQGDCTRTRGDNCSSAWSRDRAASSTRYVYRGHGGQRGSRSQINKSVLYLSQTEALRRVELRVRLVRRRNLAAREKAKANEEK